jgi:hypothetical protein
MASMALECTAKLSRHEREETDLGHSYNGTSDLQLERMNVYFNEVIQHTHPFIGNN